MLLTVLPYLLQDHNSVTHKRKSHHRVVVSTNLICPLKVLYTIMRIRQAGRVMVESPVSHVQQTLFQSYPRVLRVQICPSQIINVGIWNCPGSRYKCPKYTQQLYNWTAKWLSMVPVPLPLHSIKCRPAFKCILHRESSWWEEDPTYSAGDLQPSSPPDSVIKSKFHSEASTMK